CMDHHSLWDCLAEFPVRAPLDGDRQADVLVIGAGLTGLLCAHRLKAQGLHCIVIDAERTCSGVTAYTTGKITQQHGLVYGPLIQNFGEEKARQYLRANLDAIQAYKQLIVGQEIACDFEAKPNVVYTLAHPERIEQELAALQRLGMPGELIQEADLPFSIRCGLRTHYSYQFNPLAFAAHIAKDLEIYENTRALHIDGNTVKTPHGVIRAEKIIVATHYPIKDMPGFYFARMSQNRSYLAAVKKAWIPDAMYVDEANQGMTFRSYRDYLIVGGMGHRSGGVGVDLYEKLEEKIDGMFPGSRMQFLWSAQDCMPMDGVPYIGQYAPTTPHLYVAGGFQKWGMSTAMAAAMILEDLVQGRDNPCAAVFSPRRFAYKASRA
ncbi:MAG: FAD-binding oxidoreductase, partial [Clostridiales bacterium]|nr:FAD-binding oxidoreductase [Clostridiales bacterium]